ncbi:Protein SRG1 [Hordeum vulgare]|nr:Protein SRG1 [Hordeum vulgare]
MRHKAREAVVGADQGEAVRVDVHQDVLAVDISPLIQKIDDDQRRGFAGRRLQEAGFFYCMWDTFSVLCSEDLSRKIMRGIAFALGGLLDAFEGDVVGDAFWVLTLIGYPVSDDIPQEEHTDIGWMMIFVLLRGGVGLLKLSGNLVSGQKPVWFGRMGYTSPRCTESSTTPPRYRVSVAFFYESNFDAAVEPVEFCWEKTGGVAKYEKVGSTW